MLSYLSDISDAENPFGGSLKSMPHCSGDLN